MLGIFFKLFFYIKKPRVILLSSENAELQKGLVYFLYKKIFHAQLIESFESFWDGLEILNYDYAIIDISEMSKEDITFILKNCSKAIIGADWVGIHKQSPDFLNKKLQGIAAIIKQFQDTQEKISLVFNNDFPGAKAFSMVTVNRLLSYGKIEGSDMKILDGEKNNFNINYDSKTYTVFCGGCSDGNINSLSMCMAIAEICNLNLFEIGQEFKYYPQFD